MKVKKTKIVLSLLIALAFILPTANIFADESKEIVEAGITTEKSDYKLSNTVSTGTGTTESYGYKPEMKTLDPVGGKWPVNATGINLEPLTAPGIYNITGTFCRPDYSEGFNVIPCDGVFDPAEGWVLISSFVGLLDQSIFDIYATADCDYVYAYIERHLPTGAPGVIDDIVMRIPGSGTWVIDGTQPSTITTCEAVDGYGGAMFPNVTISIDRSIIDGDCNTEPYQLRFQVNSGWGQMTGWTGCEPLEINFDCGPAEIKKFLEIYKWEKEDYINETIYCTDFEDPCDIYEMWSTLDKSPEWGPNGAIDTWTWTDQRSFSPDHSFHSTAFDTYLMNQHDILELNNGGCGILMENESGVPFDQVDINFSHWMEGDSIIVNKTRLIQDGGYVQVGWSDTDCVAPTSWDIISKTYYDNDWQYENFTIDVEGDYLYVRFVFFSDAAFCYEGWYIDDVCLTGIQNQGGEWVFEHDSHSHEQIMEGECIDHKFMDGWVAEEGKYLICLWLQTLDDCHYASHTSIEPWCTEVIVEYCLELVDEDLYFTPETPAWEHDDVNISSVVLNNGTINATDVQVQVTVQYGAIETALDNSFNCDIDQVLLEGETDYNLNWYQSPWADEDLYGDNARSYWHFDDTEEDGNCILINYKEDGDRTFALWDPDATGNPGYIGYQPSEWVNTPHLFEGTDKDLSCTVEFDAAWALPDLGDDQADLMSFGIAISDDSAGRLTRFLDPFDPSTTGDNNDFLSNGDGSWVHIGPIPINSLIASMVDGGTSGLTDSDLAMMIFFTKDSFDVESDLDWSGIKLDNFVIKKLTIQPEPIIFQQTKEIPYLNITETETVDFTWEDVQVGRYIVTQQVFPLDDCRPGNNTIITGYNVVNYMEELKTPEYIDHTQLDECHWMVDDCCGGSFWVGDYETTMYGEEWNDCLYIAPEDDDEEQNKTLVLDGSEDLTFWQWYQINETDYGIVEYSEDDGQHWATLTGPFDGVSDPDVDEPTGEDDWIEETVGLPAGDIQIRFRFYSDNDTIHNRGWMLDNISITGILDDECEDMDNFICEGYGIGNWWKSPDYTHWYNGSTMWDWWHWWAGGVDQFFDSASVIEDPDDTYGFYDETITSGYPGWGAGNELYPMNCNNSVQFKISNLDKIFFGFIQASTTEDMGSDNDTLFIETSNDGGETWKLFDVQDGSDQFPSMRPTQIEFGEEDCAVDELQVRWRTVTDDINDPNRYMEDYASWLPVPFWYVMYAYAGVWSANSNAMGNTVNEPIFYGMKDNNAPTSSITMSGVFDDTYQYYTSDVQVTITATDALSGISAIYYVLDGQTNTYTAPFRISDEGTHDLCYYAVDGEGNIEEMKCIPSFRIDKTGPSVSITGPAPGIYIFGNKLLNSDKYIFLFGGITVSASVNIDGAPLQTVEFYLDNVLMGEDTASPYTLTISTKHTGSATIKVIAKDVLGESAEDTLAIDQYFKLF